MTRDHSLLQEELDAGLISPEQARCADHKNLVTRAVGIDPALEVEIHEHRIAADDLYLLCSDGLSDMLSQAEIASWRRAPICRAPPTLWCSAPTSMAGAIISPSFWSGYCPGRSLNRVESGKTALPGLLGRVAHWIK